MACNQMPLLRDEAWLSKAVAEIAARSEMTFEGKLGDWATSESGALVLPGIRNADRTLFLKLGVTDSQRYWMRELSALRPAPVVPVVASGRVLAGEHLNWLLMEQVGSAVEPAVSDVHRRTRLLLTAALEFHRAAQLVPPKYVAVLTPAYVAEWFARAQLAGAPAAELGVLSARLEDDFEFVSRVCDFEVCHGDLQHSNLRWIGALGRPKSLLLDPEPITQPWALEAIVPEIVTATVGTARSISGMNRLRRWAGLSACSPDALERLESICLGWEAARLWNVLLHEIARAAAEHSYVHTMLESCLQRASAPREPDRFPPQPRPDAARRFCHRPFTFFETDESNEARVCCADWLPMPIGRVTDGELASVWNSESAQAIRGSILDGSFAHCDGSTCPALVQGTLPTVAETRKTPYYRRLIDENVTALERGPLIINFGHDNSCNLKCPTCRPELIYLTGTRRAVAADVQKKIEAEFLDHAHELIITGHGDALASTIYRQFLETFDADRHPDTSIILMTNGILFTQPIWQKLSGAHDAIVGVTISVDAATAATYTINRGANFGKLTNNLRFVGSLVDAGKLWAEISFVVQTNNYKEMPAFVELAKSLHFSSVLFQRMIPWAGTISLSEFESRAVHLPRHPEHAAFLAVLSDPLLRDPIVDLSNLQYLIDGPAEGAEAVGAGRA